MSHPFLNILRSAALSMVSVFASCNVIHVSPFEEDLRRLDEAKAFRLEAARKRNFERWSINESVDWVHFPSLGSYEKELQYLKDFYTARLEWLDKELNRL